MRKRYQCLKEWMGGEQRNARKKMIIGLSSLKREKPKEKRRKGQEL